MAKAYQIIDNTLYKTTVTNPLLRCLSKAEDIKLLSEIHVGISEGTLALEP
jgi:hypothetical protein